MPPSLLDDDGVLGWVMKTGVYNCQKPAEEPSGILVSRV